MKRGQRAEKLSIEPAGRWGVGLLLAVELTTVVVFWYRLAGPLSWTDARSALQDTTGWLWLVASMAILLGIVTLRARAEDTRALRRAEEKVRRVPMPSNVLRFLRTRPPQLPHSPSYHPSNRRAG